ncbi:hypothetical protein BDM02DRAFT_3120579 [Thelephora ganbajun]|uniref:Uncharacterized protein n=1 Tax=Thelephora ganbajun TaxID=370292 RepID=A0ACB6Z7A2_THEGA|nr:hypothetical protein BDM02DRAFT_3120579 [Thelephora ganbajun]
MLSTPPPQFLITAMDKGLSVPPLDAEKFNGSFKHFCSVKRLMLDWELLHVAGRKVNLYSLHEEIMRHRAYDIRQRGPEFWLKIGMRLGFIQSQGMTPASTEIADRLAKIYKRYLGEFDAIYVMSFVQELQQRMSHAMSIG